MNMILATYQPLDWKTWKNDRYSKLKEILGIPQEKNIYWCFPANTPEQALINSCCTEANQPAVLVMFKAEKYRKIDKIKWNRYVETDDESLLNEDLLNVAHAEMAEYIVTDIPEDCVEFPLIEYKDCNRTVEVINTIEILGGAGTFEGIMSRYFFTLQMFTQKKRACEMFIVVPVISASIVMFADEDTVLEPPLPCSVPPMEKYSEVANKYVQWYFDVAEMTDETAYKKLKAVQQEIFNLYFGHNYVKKIKGTVHPKMLCPCGSGKPYKKCCSKKADMPDITEVMSKGIE